MSFKDSRNKFFVCFVSILQLCFFSSCIKTYKLAPSETPQGEALKNAKNISKQCVRSAKVYDEWETSATFDVLWLSDDARKNYVDTYCSRRGKSQAELEAMIAKGAKESRTKATFYLLADVRDRLHPDMNDKKAAWTICLEVGGERIAPDKDSIKEVELSPELRAFFGYRYKKPKFKTSYVVTFSTTIARDKPFKMFISSVSSRCELGWNGGGRRVIVSNNGKEGIFEQTKDYYW